MGRMATAKRNSLHRIPNRRHGIPAAWRNFLRPDRPVLAGGSDCEHRTFRVACFVLADRALVCKVRIALHDEPFMSLAEPQPFGAGAVPKFDMRLGPDQDGTALA